MQRYVLYGSLTKLFKSLIVSLTAVIVAAVSAAPCFAQEYVKHVTTIDLTKGRVSGEGAQFYIDVPTAWRESVTAEREKTAQGGVLLEQINFYCAALSAVYKPQPLLNLYVFDRHKWGDDGKYTPVLQSRDYVFCVKYGANDFKLKGDIAVYQTVFSYVSTAVKCAKLIKLPPAQELVAERRVFADGDRLFYGSELIGGIYYVRLRETAEALGFTVEWNTRSRTVKVANEGFEDHFQVLQSNEDWRGIKMRNIQGRVYVSTGYFFRVLSVNVEIDSKKNIYLSSQ